MNREAFEIEQSDIDQTRLIAEGRLKQLGWNDDQIKHIRIKCKKDLWFLAYSILGYTALSPQLHGDLCITLQSTNDRKYRLFLYPRSHFKTTIVTKTDSLQIALPDDVGDSVYPRSLGPNVRILLAHEKRERAAEFLFDITQHFTTNPLLVALFPECVPTLKKQRLNKFELELPRTQIWSEPTFATTGVGGKSQGSHYNVIKLDDIYGTEAATSVAERKTAIDWFDNIQSFLVTPKTDKIDIVGTRWAFDDVYAHAMMTYGDKLFKVIRKAIENGVPIFPENFDLEDFEILKKNPRVWNAQYANDPREGAASFKPEWKQYYNYKGRDIALFSLNDNSETIRFDSLDRLLFVDPAINGKSGLIVTGTDEKHRIFILDAVKKEYKTEELLETIFQLGIKYKVRAVVVEEVIFSALYDPIITSEKRKRNATWQLIMHKVGKTEKSMRVNGLSNYFSAKQIYMNPAHTDLLSEFDQFGATEDYHILDALAMGPRYWRAGFQGRLRDKFIEAENDLMLGMDSISGYSKI
jgi:hypothetical protein